MSTSQEYKFNEQKPVDLVKVFYDQDIDHKALEKALVQKQNTAKSITNFSLDPYTGEFGPKQKKHLLNRILLGYSKRHYNDIIDYDLQNTIELIFEKEQLGEPINNYYLELSKEEYFRLYNNEDVDPLEPFINRPVKGADPQISDYKIRERLNALITWLGEKIYNQKTSIHWKLFIFLHNLVPGEFDSDVGHQANYLNIKLKFDSCFSSYKDFIYNITKDINMLRYLNLNLSRKETPDENYAREVQELFTVGKRPFSKFSEGDVREIAKSLVGWTYDWSDLWENNGIEQVKSFFDPSNHDTTDKQFSSFYSNKKILGKSGIDGEKELNEVIDMLFDTEESSIYIVRRLYQFFVYPILTEDIENEIIKPLAIIFKENNFSLIEPLKILLSSEHFYENVLINSMIKSPLEFNFGIIKQVDLLNGRISAWDGQQSYNPDSNPAYFGNFSDYNYVKYRFFTQFWGYYSAGQGFSILKPPSVSGWPPYYQDPIFDMFWLNSDTLQKRKKMLSAYGKYGFAFRLENGVYGRLYPDPMVFLSMFENPGNFELFIEELIEMYLNIEIEDSEKQKIRAAILSGASISHWEDEYQKYLNGQNYDSGVFEEGLREGVSTILELACYQLF